MDDIRAANQAIVYRLPSIVFRLPPRGAHPTDQAAILALDLAQAREGCQQALALGFGIVNAGQQRLGQLEQRLFAKAATNKIGQRLVGIAPTRRDDQIKQHAQFAQRRQQWRSQKRPELGWHNQRHAFGHWAQPTAREKIDLAPQLVGANQLIF
jgi:hypothetical protein